MELLLIIAGLFILVLVAGNVLSVIARRERDVILPLDREQSEEAVTGCFNKMLWRPCAGIGDLNWQRRTLQDRGATVSVNFEPAGNGATLASVWMSQWQSRMGVIASPGGFAPKRVASKLRRMSESLSPSPSPSKSPSIDTELIGAGAAAEGADHGAAEPLGASPKPASPGVENADPGDAGAQSEPIEDPGLDDTDPRQVAYVFMKNCGLNVVLHGPVTAEVVIDEALRAAPVLADCRRAAGEFMRLNRDSGTHWFALEGPAGSAVVVSGTPESDTSITTPQVTFPLMRLESNSVKGELVSLGQGSQRIVELMREFDVVPVSAHPDLAHTLGDEGFHNGMPIALRRAVAGWIRFGADGYKSYFDHKGRSIEVLVSQLDDPGWPKMLVNIGDIPHADMDRLNSLVGDGPYRFETLIDDQVIFARELRENLNAEQVDALAGTMLKDLDRIVSEVSS